MDKGDRPVKGALRRKGTPQAPGAPRTAPTRQCWPRQPQSSPSGAGVSIPQIPLPHRRGLLWGLPRALLPCAWASVTRKRPAQTEGPRAPRGSQRWRGKRLRNLAVPVAADSEPLERSGDLHRRQNGGPCGMQLGKREVAGQTCGVTLSLVKYIMHGCAST